MLFQAQDLYLTPRFLRVALASIFFVCFSQFFVLFCFVLFCFVVVVVVVVVVIVIVDLYDGFRRKGWTANSQPREKTEKANSRMCLHVNAIW